MEATTAKTKVDKTQTHSRNYEGWMTAHQHCFAPSAPSAPSARNVPLGSHVEGRGWNSTFLYSNDHRNASKNTSFNKG